jgi:hypothetical protein
MRAIWARRDILKATALGLFAGLTTRLQAQTPRKKAALTAEDEKTAEAVRATAKKAGLGGLETRTTEHFLGIGNAPAAYSDEGLKLCESFSREFLAHYQDLGFKVAYPARRMTVVMLKDVAAYHAYLGEPDEVAGGHYDRDTNQLVVFDMRSQEAELKAAGSDAERVNTFTLVHETAHLLSFNTGLFPSGRDVPVAISEGLATYSEFWSPHQGRAAFGRMNEPRLRGLGRAADAGIDWIPIAKLLSDDELFYDPKTADLAYAECWLLARHVLRQPAKLSRFKAYLAGLPKPDGPPHRDAYAESVLGSLKDLDLETRGYAKQVQKRRR